MAKETLKRHLDYRQRNADSVGRRLLTKNINAHTLFIDRNPGDELIPIIKAEKDQLEKDLAVLEKANSNACYQIGKYDFLCLAPGLTYGWGDTYAEAKKNCRSAYGTNFKAYAMYIVPPKAKYHDTGCITVPPGTFSPILVDEVKK